MFSSMFGPSNLKPTDTERMTKRKPGFIVYIVKPIRTKHGSAIGIWYDAKWTSVEALKHTTLAKE